MISSPHNALQPTRVGAFNSAVAVVAGFFAVLLIVIVASSSDAAGASGDTNLLRLSIGQTLAPEDQSRAAEVEGTVNFASRNGSALYLELGADSGYLPVNVARDGTNLAELLLKGRIRARGVCVGVRRSADGKLVAGLSVSSANDVTILQLPEETWQRFPLSAIGALASTNFTAGQIVHLRGRVETAQAEGRFLLADASGKITVLSPGPSPAIADSEVEVLGACRSTGSNLVFQCAFFRPLNGVASEISLPLLSTTAQIRWLKPEEAARKYPIKVRGVITNLRTDRKGGDIQDGTGGIFFWHADFAPGISNVSAGDFCELEGVTDAGSFSPQIIPSVIVVLGPGQFPEPLRPGWDELIHGGLDAQWVEVQGVGVSVSNRTLNLRMKGGDISCVALGGLGQYVGAVVRVRGAALSQHNSDRRVVGVRILVPSRKFISVQSPALADPFSAPAMHVADLFLYNPDEYAFQRVKISGQIIQKRNGVCYVMDGTNGMRLMPKDETQLAAGDLIEAVGFPDIESPFDKPRLTLREAVVRAGDRAALPAARELGANNLPDREHDSTRVQIESQLLSAAQYRGEQVLELQTGTRVYRARLSAASGQLPQLQPNSRVRAVGTYVTSADKEVPFELLLNSPDDIRVLEFPSWWTVRHAIGVISGLTVLILLAMIWIGMLRRRVEKRTEQLSAANQSLKNEISERKRAENELVAIRTQHLIEQERTRIARDLHDDLGSRVTRMVLLLDELSLRDQLPPAEAAEHPSGISVAAREIIQSLDETVWAVNPRNDTLPHLLNYFSSFAVEFLNAAGMRCRLDFPDHPPDRALTAEARHNLFLAVKESLTNAVRHARAREVRLRAEADNEALTLTIEDDGKGFDGGLLDQWRNGSADDRNGPAIRESGRPFPAESDGLQNMRQRMEAMGGKFDIQSAPNAGTKVTLTFFWQPKAHL